MHVVEGECYVWHQCFAPHYGVAGFVKATRRTGGQVVLTLYQNAACVIYGPDSYREFVGPCGSCINDIHIACEPHVAVASSAAIPIAASVAATTAVTALSLFNAL